MLSCDNTGCVSKAEVMVFEIVLSLYLLCIHVHIQHVLTALSLGHTWQYHSGFDPGIFKATAWLLKQQPGC